MNKRLLYLVALLEGFSTLAVEMIGLRMAAPLVGSSIILTSVYLGIILCALSVGYYFGGILTTKVHKSQLFKILGGYLLITALWYLFITFGQATALLGWMLTAVDSYVVTLFLTAVVLFFMPVFLASQTLPLLTELLPVASKGESAGVILFASTVGSFLGSVLTSIVLFESIGVQATGVVVTACLFLAVTLLWLPHKKRWSLAVFLGGCLVVFFGKSIFPAPDPQITYTFDSAYQTIQIRQGFGRGGPVRIFQMNGAFSSGINPETMKSPFPYIRKFVSITEKEQPKHILVIGAAGFVYPLEVSWLQSVERIDTVDIDPQVKNIAENKFLFQDLPKKVVFYPHSARWFVNQALKNNTTYDLIVLDAYNGRSIPDELTTVEFFKGINHLLAPDGKLVANFILDTKLDSAFAQNILSSFKDSFGSVYTSNITSGEKHTHDNFIVSNEAIDTSFTQQTPTGIVYTDNLRSTETDIVQMFWSPLPLGEG